MMHLIVICSLALFVCFGCLAEALGADNGSLDNRLRQIDSQRRGPYTETERLENECVKLLDDYPSPEERGEIYAQIAKIYAQSGVTQPNKILEYCEKAIRHPLSTENALQLYVFWVDALQVKYRGANDGEFVIARRDIVKPCLRGLNLLVDADLPRERQPLPAVDRIRHDGPINDPAYLALVRKRDEQVAARKKAMLQNELIRHHKVLVKKCIRLYCRAPHNSAELADLAREIFGEEHEQAVQELVARVEEAIKKQSPAGKPQ